MGCSWCEKKRQLLIEQARARLEAHARWEIYAGDAVVLKKALKWKKKLPEPKGPRSVCPNCGGYRFYCQCTLRAQNI